MFLDSAHAITATNNEQQDLCRRIIIIHVLWLFAFGLMWDFCIVDSVPQDKNESRPATRDRPRRPAALANFKRMLEASLYFLVDHSFCRSTHEYDIITPS